MVGEVHDSGSSGGYGDPTESQDRILKRKEISRLSWGFMIRHLLTFLAKWYRSTFYNALILGICNFMAPGIWGAMNSLGAGGEEKPYLVNTANALTFCLMVVSCFFSSVLVRYIGIKWALIFGTIGYAPYAAGLYTNNRFGNEWLVLLGAALCGISAGVFWMAEAAIALSYPEPYNQGKFLGFWLSFRLGGQILGGAINLGLNADNSKAGKVSYVVYLIFIALQACGPIVALLLNKPEQVERTDDLKVHLSIVESPWYEIQATTKLFFSKNFLLIVPLIGQAVYGSCHVHVWISYFVVGEIARSEGEIVRIAALLRGIESAWQAVSYGLNAVPIFAQVGGVYLNFALWFLALVPAWLVIRKISISLGDRKVDRDQRNHSIAEGNVDAGTVEKEAVSFSKGV
ncbi:MAG: hypothetical protein Q9191_005128 [Dirinaria sp. TL-2023a]